MHHDQKNYFRTIQITMNLAGSVELTSDKQSSTQIFQFAQSFGKPLATKTTFKLLNYQRTQNLHTNYKDKLLANETKQALNYCTPRRVTNKTTSFEYR